jgi:nucleotide-binding universal stress UspA family protein
VTTPTPGLRTNGLIVVGVDGSSGSHHALEFAVAEARLRDARIQAVMAWQVPAMVDSQMILDDFNPEGWARAGLDNALATAKTGGFAIEGRLVQGHPATALIDACADADLLVVGSHGHGGFVGALLGSVSHRCVAHAPCPVVVVPPPQQTRAGEG